MYIEVREPADKGGGELYLNPIFIVAIKKVAGVVWVKTQKDIYTYEGDIDGLLKKVKSIDIFVSDGMIDTYAKL